jgi:endo-1,3-1,4-beta-glycanase ExoK
LWDQFHVERGGHQAYWWGMGLKKRVWAVLYLGLCGLLLSSTALAKSYKSGEFETKTRYGFGAFEARIRSAQGPGVISTFFLWKPDSEKAPAVPWHEIDFEMGQASGDYQTQIMTPGSSPPLYRREHVVAHGLSARPYQAYYTYRIEWTPDYIAFFVDGKEVRRETDHNEFSVMFAKDASGDTPVGERMELRTGVWPGDPSIFSWSGAFDGSTVPTAHFVDYVKIWDYTPNQADKFATVLLDEQFNSLNNNVWYPAQWTFDFSASDYVSQNIGVRDGRLVVALTTTAGQGILPAPPADVPPTPPSGPTVADGFVLEAEKPDSYFDTSAGNVGTAACGTSDVDATLTPDPTGGICTVGWTTPTEWLAYDVQLTREDEYVVTLRAASNSTAMFMHLEVDGIDVSGPVYGPGIGWQSFVDRIVPGVFMGAGAHSVRLVFDTGDMNVNYLIFARVSGPIDPGQCQMSCDDANPCTTDSCDPLTGCKFLNNALGCADDGNTCTSDVCSAGACTHPNNTSSCADDGNTCTSDVCSAGACTHPNNTSSCADDGNACTNDVCSAGACTHPSNSTCTAGTPCTGLCTNPVTFTSSNYNSGNIGTGAACYQTTSNLNGGVCGNFAAGRKLTVNGVQMSCGSNWPSPMPAKRNGGYCIQTNAGSYPWAYFASW